MKRGTVEFYAIQAQFEKNLKLAGFASLYDFSKPCSEELEKLPKSEFYNNGETNKAFRIYMLGYANAKWEYQN